MKIKYDPNFDVLYFNIEENANDYAAEENESVVTFKSTENDKVTGYVIYNFKEWLYETVKKTSESTAGSLC